MICLHKRVSPTSDICPNLPNACNCPDTKKKAGLTRALFKEVNCRQYSCVLPCFFPDLSGRPNKLELLAPKHVPRCRISTGRTGRVALLHAIAQIELKAIDLALDMAGRYATYGLPFDFVVDWLFVANDEAKHFMLLSDRLESLDIFYGALPAHDCLWEAAWATGKRWFDSLCGCERRDLTSSWQGLVRRYFKGDLKPPFIIKAQTAVKFSAAFYGPLAAERS